jgi:hypothetical protein
MEIINDKITKNKNKLNDKPQKNIQKIKTEQTYHTFKF